MRKIDRERRKMEKKQAKLCKMIDGISWWLDNGKDRGVPEKCFLQNGVQAAERIFQTRSQKRNNRTSGRSFTAEQSCG